MRESFFDEVEDRRDCVLFYRTIAFDNDPLAPGRTHCDKFVQVDLKDPVALLGQAETASPDGVFVHAAELAVEVARITEALGLPGLSVDVADRATDKSRRIATLAAAGIATPAFEILESADSLEQWIEQVEARPYPVVLKPTDQAGARGVESIATRVALENYYQRRNQFDCTQFVCEERLVGSQLSTESVAARGKILHHAIALRHYDTTAHYQPFFIEDGHSLPVHLPPPQRTAVEQTIARCFEALGVQDGVLKGDLLITDAGDIVVLEMAVRTSGGRFADTVVPLGTGVNILYPLVEMAMNDGFSRDWFNPTRRVGVSQRFFLHPRESQVAHWPALRELVLQPGVSEWRINESMFSTGQLPPVHSHRDRFGYVICTGATREDADQRALGITSSFARSLVLGPASGRTDR